MAKGEWITAPAESDSSSLTIIVTARRDVAAFRANPRFTIRVEVSWLYDNADSLGMPSVADSTQMEKVTDALTVAFDKDPVAVMTGIYTGDGRRDWIFYTLSTNIFGRKLNEALADIPVMPLKIYCENDPDWDEYNEMISMFPTDDNF